MPDLTKPDTSSRAHGQKPLATWRRAFLAALTVSPNVTAAAKAAGIARPYAYQCRDNDPSFAQEWDAALEAAIDSLEQECWNRAMGNNIKFLFDKDGSPLLHPHTGQPYYEHQASDAMATLLLKAHRPDKYKDRSALDLNAQVTTKPALDKSKLTDEELDQLETLLRKGLPQ
jgi:hypothetical protein